MGRRMERRSCEVGRRRRSSEGEVVKFVRRRGS